MVIAERCRDMSQIASGSVLFCVQADEMSSNLIHLRGLLLFLADFGSFGLSLQMAML